ncbi:MAG: DUF4139 domain-containing protein [Deferribacteres bacterium]|nr:DUF4139 domain-containing protein [candidate division KSB1 bacterium]MCB9502236.1 DUF4139 domain-containing protein [Deferribacteres bacterium]
MQDRKLVLFLLVFGTVNLVLAQNAMHLTVYNNNAALVSEQRELMVPSGGLLEFPDVAERIIPASVLVDVKNSPQTLQILEQNFEYDLVGSAKIFDKYIDEKITLQTEHSGELSGVLLNNSGNDIVLQMPGGQLVVMEKKEILSTYFAALPEGLRTRPTLTWNVKNTGPQKRMLNVSYLTNGISWHAEYVGELDKSDASLTLAGWISIDNHSGKSYKNASLKLVAGDINQQKQGSGEREVYKMLALAEASADVEEKPFFEYHLYSLGHTTDVRNNQIKQVTFIEPTRARVKKQFVYEGSRNARNVAVQIKLHNSEQSGLGIPLPAGIFRIYKADDDDSKVFLGEDELKHTPKDEEILLSIGNAFDLIGERKELFNNKLSKRSDERGYEITLRNHKKQPVEVVVVERFHGDWEITESSSKVIEKTALKAEWLLQVPAEDETKLNFVVRSQW